MSDVCPIAMAQDYTDSLPFIEKLAKRFADKYHTNVDDLLSEANWIFHKAYTSPKWGTTSISWGNYLHQWLWNSWLDTHRTLWSRNARYEYVADFAAVSKAYTDTSPDDITANLTEDAAFVCQLVFDMPKEVVAAAESRGGKSNNYKACLRGYLREMGWAASRVSEAFAEIRSI